MSGDSLPTCALKQLHTLLRVDEPTHRFNLSTYDRHLTMLRQDILFYDNYWFTLPVLAVPRQRLQLQPTLLLDSGDVLMTDAVWEEDPLYRLK